MRAGTGVPSDARCPRVPTWPTAPRAARRHRLPAPRRLPARPRSATQAQPPGVSPRDERRALRPADPGRRARVPAQARARADRRRRLGDAARPAPPYHDRCRAGGRSAGRREPGAISARARDRTAGPGRPGHPGLTGGYVRRLAAPARAPRPGARAVAAAGGRLARAAPAADRQGACAGSAHRVPGVTGSPHAGTTHPTDRRRRPQRQGRSRPPPSSRSRPTRSRASRGAHRFRTPRRRSAGWRCASGSSLCARTA